VKQHPEECCYVAIANIGLQYSEKKLDVKFCSICNTHISKVI